VQARLTVGPADDAYEQEADQMAAQVMRMPDPAPDMEDVASQPPAVRRKEAPEEEEEVRRAPQVPLTPAPEEGQVQKKSAPQNRDPRAGFELEGGLEGELAASKGRGQQLPDGTRTFMETRFGADFGNVRVHTGDQSDALNRKLSAQAFTHGSDIFFGSGKYNPQSSGGQQLLAHELTHVVQQGASEVQRHPGHAAEEDVRTKRLAAPRKPILQLHPSHAEEEEVRRKLVQSRTGGGRIQRGLISWIKKRWKGVAAREAELTAKYGIQIGPGNGPGSHFSHAVLDKLDKVLSRIPLSHIRGTYMTGIQRGGGIGAASAYSQDDEDSGHIGIVQPPLGPFREMPGWLYTMLSKGVGWQRRLMDQGAIGSLAPNVNDQEDQQLGLDNAQRGVFAGVSDVLSRGNLVEWTVRHEMGHAVDHKIKWTSNRAQLPQFGGWKQYDSDNQAHMDEIATGYLAKAGINYPNRAVRLNRVQADTVTPLSAIRRLFGDGEANLATYSRQQLVQQDADFGRKWDLAIRLIKIAKAQPWMFPDGGAGQLEHQGRVVHLDHYDTWVSYLTHARANHGLSNYMYSSPGEWFAEAYAAFYDPDPNSAARNRLNDATRNWFTKNLGAPPQPGQPAPAAPALQDEDTGELQELAELGPEMLEELQDGEDAEIEDVPEDLKQDEDNRLGGF
jgi:hypothetical protein